jgi:hypothetical protein
LAAPEDGVAEQVIRSQEYHVLRVCEKIGFLSFWVLAVLDRLFRAGYKTKGGEKVEVVYGQGGFRAATLRAERSQEAATTN